MTFLHLSAPTTATIRSVITAKARSSCPNPPLLSSLESAGYDTSGVGTEVGINEGAGTGEEVCVGATTVEFEEVAIGAGACEGIGDGIL